MNTDSSPPSLAQFDVPESKRAAIAALCRVPKASPAALGWFLVSTGGVIAVDALAVLGRLGLGWACLANTILMYWQFTVVHDSIHRSAAKNHKLNDWIGRIGVLTFGPQITLGIFRWAHVQHHRYTSGPKDPDRWMHGPWWSLFFRWVALDVGYLMFVLRHGDTTAKRLMRDVWRHVAVTLATVVALVYLGYGMDVLMLWFIPARLTFVTVGGMFFWLPHVKNDVSADQDVTLATSVRLGHEWLLTPLCQFHNYHLIHHLFPSMPSYQHVKAWRLLEPELMKRNLQIQYGFAIQPVVRYGH